jgi:anti-sigma factor RsiW
MTAESKIMSNAFLHAYVDGQLNAAQREEVEAYLKAHPLKARQVEQYRQINARMHARFDASLHEPLSEAVLALGQSRHETNASPVAARPLWWTRAAAVVAWMMVGGASGWLLHAGLDRASPAAARIAQRAIEVHRAYAREGRHVVEVGAAEKEHIMTWLSGRLGSKIGPADLTGAGYVFLGGRLLPAGDHVAGVYMYEDAQRERLTEYISVEPGADAGSTPQCNVHEHISTCEWSDGTLSFVLVGAAAPDALRTLAEQVREQARRAAP